MYPEIEQLKSIDAERAHAFIRLALADFSKRLANSNENEFNKFAELDPLREMAGHFLSWYDKHLLEAIEKRDNDFKDQYRSVLRDHFALGSILDSPAHATLPRANDEDEPDWDEIENEVLKEVETGK